MRSSRIGPRLAIFAAVAAIAVAACSSSGASPSAAPTAVGSAAPSARSDLKIGVVTDVGTVNDKNFNEYTYIGAKDGAAAIGAPEPPVVGPEGRRGLRHVDPVVRRPGLQHDRHGRLQPRRRDDQGGQGPPGYWFIGVDQAPICVDETGELDTTFACKGDAATLAAELHRPQLPGGSGRLPRRAWSPRPSARAGVIGAIGGITLCGPVHPLHPGLSSSAPSRSTPTSRSVPPMSPRATSPRRSTTRSRGKSVRQAVHRAEQESTSCSRSPARPATASSTPPARRASTASASTSTRRCPIRMPRKCTRDERRRRSSHWSVESTIKAIGGGTAKGGDDHWRRQSRRRRLRARSTTSQSAVPADLKAKLDAAFAEMKAGTLKTCPDNCGEHHRAAVPAVD